MEAELKQVPIDVRFHETFLDLYPNAQHYRGLRITSYSVVLYAKSNCARLPKAIFQT